MLASPLSSSRTSADWALLWLRLAGSTSLLRVHGLAKLLDFEHQLALIEDPFGLGSHHR